MSSISRSGRSDRYAEKHKRAEHATVTQRIGIVSGLRLSPAALPATQSAVHVRDQRSPVRFPGSRCLARIIVCFPRDFRDGVQFHIAFLKRWIAEVLAPPLQVFFLG